VNRRRLLPNVMFLVLLLGLAGCGVAATARAVDEGDAATGASSRENRVDWRVPEDANSAADLVRYFLQAAAGGDAEANDRAKKFLTASAQERWQDPPDVERPALTVVRVVGAPVTGADVDGRTRVTLDYEIVGTMTDQGRVDDLAPLAERRLTFWVVPEADLYLRIDEIVGWPGGLLISTEALDQLYRIQPIYFWDTDYQLLVPDLRYVPLTINSDPRARQVLQWLLAGPSPWLSGLQRLPSGLSPGDVSTDSGGTLQVSLTGDAAGIDSPGARAQLMYQLQWSLFPPDGAAPRLAVRVNDLPVEVGESDFRRYNHGWAYDDAEPDLYDIGEQGVVRVSGLQAAPRLLGAEQNADVVFAAIDRDGTVAALVRTEPSGRRSVQILRDGQADHLATRATGFNLGRPSFVPQTDVVLVPTGGRLWSVSAVDGSVDDATHTLAGVTVAAVSPDGRRVAVVAGNEVYVASLVVVNGRVNVASSRRQLLAGRLGARAVTWLSGSELLVGGTTGSGQAAALWRVSADGVRAEDLSVSGNLSGIGRIDDLVCYPVWTAHGRVEVLAVTPQGVYTFRNRVLSQQSLVAPFFGT
jgi:hypothetical protein